MTLRKFATYEEFFTYYLQQHSDSRNRLLHAWGSGMGLAVLIAAIVLGHYWLALLWIPIGYGFAWVGHLLIERNEPATWQHPWWSFLSDFRMMWLMIAGKLDSEVKAQEKTAAE